MITLTDERRRYATKAKYQISDNKTETSSFRGYSHAIICIQSISCNTRFFSVKLTHIVATNSYWLFYQSFFFLSSYLTRLNSHICKVIRKTFEFTTETITISNEQRAFINYIRRSNSESDFVDARKFILVINKFILVDNSMNLLTSKVI